jgi:hypothetical protein
MPKPKPEQQPKPAESIAERVLELERLYPGGGDVEIPAPIWAEWVEQARKERGNGN